MKCNRCGAELLKGTKFCAKCGSAAIKPVRSKISIKGKALIGLICSILSIILVCVLVPVILFSNTNNKDNSILSSSASPTSSTNNSSNNDSYYSNDNNSCYSSSSNINISSSSSSQNSITSDIQSPEDVSLQTYLKRAEGYIDAGKYTEAIATLDTAKQLFGDSARIEALQTKIEKKQLLNTVSKHEKLGDYASALKAINGSSHDVQSDTDVVQKFNSIKVLFVNKVVSDAETVFDAYGYADAISVINKGLNILPDNATLLAKLDKYNDYKPIKLSELKRIDNNWRVYDDWSGNDAKGNRVNNAWLVLTYSEPQSAEIYTGRKYSILTFDILPSGSFSTDINTTATIRIFADDTLVYTSPSINYKSSAVHAEININNAEYIRIEGCGSSGENAYTILKNVLVSK